MGRTKTLPVEFREFPMELSEDGVAEMVLRRAKEQGTSPWATRKSVEESLCKAFRGTVTTKQIAEHIGLALKSGKVAESGKYLGFVWKAFELPPPPGE